MASTELSGNTVKHSPYAVSNFELGRPCEHRENGWEHFLDDQEVIIKKDDENSRPLNLICISYAL